MNIFQQVFANVNRRNSDLILRKENTDQNQLGYLKKSPLKKKKPMPKGKKSNLKKKDDLQQKSTNDVKDAIEPVLEERVKTLDSIIDASLLATIETNKKENEKQEEASIAENNDNDQIEDNKEESVNQSDVNENKLSLSTAVSEEKTQEIIGNLLKTVQIEKKSQMQTPIKSDNVDLANVTPKNDNMTNSLTPKSASRLPRKINSIPKDRDYLKMPIPEIIINDDIDEDEMREKYMYISEKLYSTQLQLEEANERNKQLEDRVYELEMRLNEFQFNKFQGQ